MVTAVPGIKFGLAFLRGVGACLSAGRAPTGHDRAGPPERAGDLRRAQLHHLPGRRLLPHQRAERRQAGARGVPRLLRHGQSHPGHPGRNGAGRGILGVVDGSKSKGVEEDDGIAWRKSFLRKIGYKLA